MEMNMDALKALELKLAEYSKENGSIAKHESLNNNLCNGCAVTCQGLCHDNGCGATCASTTYNKNERNLT